MSVPRKIWTGLILGTTIITLTWGFQVASDAYAVHNFTVDAPSNRQFSSLLGEYRSLIKKIGAREAQEVLQKALPADSRGHLLAHEAGAALYTTEGESGIAGCATYFANACFHGFLIAMTEEKGTGETRSLYNACARGLERSQVLDCAHGLGHAFLQYIGYEDLPDALDLCASTFENATVERNYCYGGVFMDNNFGEFNSPPPDRWYREDDPMYPCNAPEALAHPGAHKMCWFMQSQGLLNAYAYPRLQGSIPLASAYCDILTDEDRVQCFNGISLAIQQKAGNALLEIQKLCAEMPANNAPQCVWDAVGVGYYYGERKESSDIFTICESARSAEKNACRDTILSYLVYSYTRVEDRVRACAPFPPETRAACEERMRDSDDAYVFPR